MDCNVFALITWIGGSLGWRLIREDDGVGDNDAMAHSHINEYNLN